MYQQLTASPQVLADLDVGIVYSCQFKGVGLAYVQPSESSGTPDDPTGAYDVSNRQPFTVEREADTDSVYVWTDAKGTIVYFKAAG